MIVVEHESIELDHCVNCSGVWFDAGELELLLENLELVGINSSLNNILSSNKVETPEKKRRCPICGKKMKKMTIGHKPEVLIDACPLGDGLWFDSGEVGQLIKQLQEKPDFQGRIINFLGEVFKS